MKNILLLICLTTILVSCHKETVPAAHSKQVIVPCSQSNNWTKESINNALRGNWLLYRVETEAGQQSVPYTRLTFLDSVLLVWDTPVASTKHSKYVVEENSGNLTIHADSNLAGFVSGNLYLCGDYLICSGSAFDGADRFYKRD